MRYASPKSSPWAPRLKPAAATPAHAAAGSHPARAPAGAVRPTLSRNSAATIAVWTSSGSSRITFDATVSVSCRPRQRAAGVGVSAAARMSAAGAPGRVAAARGRLKSARIRPSVGSMALSVRPGARPM